jgi:CHASE3 domain sensor protein
MKLYKRRKSFKILAPGSSLRRRVAYSLALVRLILVPVIFLAVYYIFKMAFIVDHIVRVDAPAASYAQQASIEMLEARRAERNYLLLHDPSYLQQNRDALNRVRQILEQIRDLGPDNAEATGTAIAALNEYQQRFSTAVKAVGEPNQTSTERIQAVVRAYEQDLNQLLETSRYKKRAQLVDDLRKRVGSFDSQISESVQTANPGLRETTEDLQATSEKILHLCRELESANWARVEADRADARRLLSESEWALGIVSFFTLIFSVWVSFILPRQVVKPLVNLREAVDHAATGNYVIDFDIQGEGEVVELARSIDNLLARVRQHQ